MVSFNAKINSHKEFFLLDSEHDYVIKRIGSVDMLKSEFDYNARYLKSGYRLFIQYKDAHPVESLAGHCFRWECVLATGKIANVKCLDCDSNDGLGDPVFDSIAGAVLITDKCVVTYGDTWIEAVEIRGENVVCKAYVCGCFVSEFKIPADVFDSLFGLKENFPMQYEKPVQTETKSKCEQAVDLIDEAKRNIESCMNLLDTHECQLERAMDEIKLALMDIDDQKCELRDMLSKLDNTLRKLK